MRNEVVNVEKRKRNGRMQYQVTFKNGIVTGWLDEQCSFNEKGIAILLKNSRFNFMNEEGKLLGEWNSYQYYLEKDFLFFFDETIKIDKNNYTVEEETVDYRQNAYIPNTEKIEKEITKEEILNFYKELAKFVNKKYADEEENN